MCLTRRARCDTIMADNRLAYGLAKKHGIDTEGMTPKQVWEALKKAGIDGIQRGSGAKIGSIRPGEGERAPWADKEKPKERKKIPLDYFGKKGHKKLDRNIVIPVEPKEVYGFYDKNKLKAHFKKHKEDFNFKDEIEYNNAAVDFWNNNSKVFYIAHQDRFARMGKDGLTVCVCDADGQVHSYYKFHSAAKLDFYIKTFDWRLIHE